METPQTEHTPFYPRSPYGAAKAYGHFITDRVRRAEIPSLIGDASKLRALGWRPTHTVTEALQNVIAEVS